ncbi:MAG: diaminopimelate decarboxylase [Saprospiraceae bacterium]|nr:diaminopimelate decarboxylase [Saprospiraceae bacterium]
MDHSLGLSLVEKYGTPLYVYDGHTIERQFQRLNQAFDVDELKINYACKALSNINILKLMKRFGAGLDTVSIQEVKLGLKAGFDPKAILYTPNCVGFDEIEAAVRLGVGINIDNIEMLETFGHEYPGHPVCIRFNPHIMAGGNQNISVGHIDSKFGISIYQLPLVQRLVETLDINVNGVHMHTGSDIMDIEVFLRATDILFDTARHFPDLEFIDFGSGFKVPYKEGDIETDIEEFGKQMSEKFNGFCKDYGRDLALVFEPGKYLVSEAGFFLARVNVVKQTTSTIFAGIDSGFNHMIRPMLYNAHHEIHNISNPGGKPRVYTIVGYICETDTFGINRRMHEVRPGDILRFDNAGAYCFTMASNYNSRYRPAEVLLWNGEDHLIRQRESFEDLLSGQVPLEI